MNEPHAGNGEEGTAGRSVWRRIFGGLRLIAPAVPLAFFATRFNPDVHQPLVDGVWLLAIALWVGEIWLRSRRPLLDVGPSRRDVLTFVAMMAVFVALWLPFYDNWRWAYTGDSLALYTFGAGVARSGPMINILSVRGVDNNFTYLFSVAYGWLFFIFGISLFWHRVTQLLFALASLAAIYAYFNMMLGRVWACAIICATVTNYIWLWFSYVSYGKIDSWIFYFGSLILATLIWRRPDRLALWMLCGLLGGVGLFFTPTAWSAVMAVGVILGVLALVTRRLPAAIVYGITFLLVGTPLLFQLGGLFQMAAKQTRSVYTWEYLSRIFLTILKLPYASPDYTLGVYGAFLRWPLGDLYVVGLALAALALLPPLRRWLRLPAVAAILLLLLLWDAVLLTLTNGGYGNPSTKRSYNLIPLQIFFALLPFYFVHAWIERWAWLRRGLMALLGVTLVVYAGANLLLITHPAPGEYGNNVYDGLIELRQRRADRRVLFLTSNKVHAENLAPEEFFQQAYGVRDQLTIDDQFIEETLVWACAEHLLICYEPNRDRLLFHPLMTRFGEALKAVPLLNSRELTCFDCVTSEPIARVDP